jgi:hypothetical protein
MNPPLDKTALLNRSNSHAQGGKLNVCPVRFRLVRSCTLVFLAGVVEQTRWASQIHIASDKLSGIKTKAVEQFQEQHPLVHFYFIPAHSSWLNQVEL